MSGKIFSWKTAIHWPLVLAVNVGLLFVIGIGTVRETVRSWTVDREIHALESQAQELEGQKMRLVELTNSMNSSSHVELAARSQLGWKKDGERVVVLKGWSAPTSLVREPSDVAQSSFDSNPQAWFNYFFHE